MARESWWSWREALAISAIGAATVAILASHRTPTWLRAIVVGLGIVVPFLPLLALLPQHFLATRRGLIRRSRIPCAVEISGEAIHVTRGDERKTHALGMIVRARFTRNDNWTESKVLEDALGLFGSDGREIARLPASTAGLDALLAELGARAIPIEDVYVSAPAILD